MIRDRQDNHRWVHGCGAGACGGSRERQRQGESRLHRPADRRRLGQRHRRPQFGRSRGAAAQRRCQGEIRIRDGRARRRVQAERRGSGRDQDGGRQGHHRRRHALLLGDRDRDRRHLSQVRLSGDRLGRGAARHHLSQQICRGSSRQRHDDQPERRQCRADLQARLQDRRGDPRHHRLRQGPQRIFQQGAGQDRQGQDRRHLRRDGRPAGLHRRADARSSRSIPR